MVNLIYIHTHDSGRLFSPYGYDVPTDNLKEFANDSITFNNMYCVNPTCSPSRASLLTGYNDNSAANEGWQKMGVLCVEMEAAALYMNAARCKKNALAILTVSDSLVTGEETTAQERQNSFTQMMEIALNTAVNLEKNI